MQISSCFCFRGQKARKMRCQNKDQQILIVEHARRKIATQLTWYFTADITHTQSTKICSQVQCSQSTNSGYSIAHQWRGNSCTYFYSLLTTTCWKFCCYSSSHISTKNKAALQRILFSQHPENEFHLCGQQINH